MAVTKLPRIGKGKGPPLSWPNDTAIGRRRLDHGLLREATHNRQQHRMSTLSISSKHNESNPTQYPSLPFKAPRASSYSGYKTYNHTHHSIQQSKAPRVSCKAPKKNKRPAPHPTQLQEKSNLSSNSLIDEKEDAESQKNSHTSKSSLPCSLTSKTPQTDSRPVAAKGIDWDAYDRAKAYRLKKIRIWVHGLRKSHRIVDSVAKELMAYCTCFPSPCFLL